MFLVKFYKKGQARFHTEGRETVIPPTYPHGIVYPQEYWKLLTNKNNNIKLLEVLNFHLNTGFIYTHIYFSHPSPKPLYESLTREES